MSFLTAIGLMSGTSLDGIDGAMLRSDGVAIEPILLNGQDEGLFIPYDPSFRTRLSKLFGQRIQDANNRQVKQELTQRHAQLVKQIDQKIGHGCDLIGFHGQTITHDPNNQFTWQLGDGQYLANLCERPVINDFRGLDVKNGGEGAPLAPLYHQAMMRSVEAVKSDQTYAFVNLGGISNITYIGDLYDPIKLLAGDCGSCNAPLNDWMEANQKGMYDEDGTCARAGAVDHTLLNKWLGHPYFKRPMPKSLDRDQFSTLFQQDIGNRSVADGAATLTEFAAKSIMLSLRQLNKGNNDHLTLLCTGGGRHNHYLMERLSVLCAPATVKPIEVIGFNGDFVEAQAFAYLAIRSYLGLPISYPNLTGVKSPQIGGTLYYPV